MSVRRRFIRNGLAAALQKAIRVLDQLMLVPFFLSAWGVSQYGEWLTLMVVPTVMAFADVGFGTATASAFVLRYAGREEQAAANAAASGIAATTVIVVLCTLICFCLTIYGPTTVQIKSLSIDAQDASKALALMMMARVVAFYQQIFEAFFSAARRIDVSINLQTLHSVVGLLATVFVLSLGGGMVDLAVATFIWSVIYTIGYVTVARRTLSFPPEVRGAVTISDLKLISSKGFGYLLSPVWQAVFFQGATLVVRTVLGPAAVTMFNTVRTLTRAINQFYTMVITASIAELQYEIGRGDLVRARRIFRIGLMIILVVAAAGMVALLAAGPLLYGMWTHKTLNPPPMMWLISIIAIPFNALWWPASFVFHAANRPYEFAVAALVCSAISVGAVYVFSLSYGIEGSAMGALIMDVLLCLYVFPRACKLIHQPIGELPREMLADIRKLILAKPKLS